MPVWQLDDQAEHARWLASDPQRGDGVADAAELVAVRVEDADPAQPGDEHPRCPTVTQRSLISCRRPLAGFKQHEPRRGVARGSDRRSTASC